MGDPAAVGRARTPVSSRFGLPIDLPGRSASRQATIESSSVLFAASRSRSR